MEHFIGLVPVCSVWCCASEVSRENPILHTPHTKGFCSTCTHWCSRRSVACWKIFMHCVHWKERSWFTMHWCSCGLARCEISWPQAPHLWLPSLPTCREGCWAGTGCGWACWLCGGGGRVGSGCRTIPYTALPSGFSAPWGRVCTTGGGTTACCCHASDILPLRTYGFSFEDDKGGPWIMKDVPDGGSEDQATHRATESMTVQVHCCVRATCFIFGTPTPCVINVTNKMFP